ncbi:TlpA family protein disulfide reductase [Pseudonocardia broussonetiae]|uniref:TlpA family protein disulfide reductase n=1 Tax=Pseudonocardia broussonetiae TaxID=2736640 RepID=A0A6M6JG57_9PSEU|nr:TlpA disulfide reductase family protein [Pseudonocardia broussonetiae]QJY45887.1 TlpA family protein disulfide reductase [Pseudonocardia broussonetiae]
MTRPRTGPGRAEVVSTAVVVLLVALAVFALWPRSPEAPAAAGGPAGGPVAPQAVAVPDAELAPLRAAAALPPCPVPASAPAGGPLAGVTVACLGAEGPVDLGSVAAGGPVLLNLWASWCGPCRDELPALAEYAARPGSVPVLLVDVDDDPRAALRLLTDLGVELPSALDTGSALRTALDVPPGLPYSFLARADGSVARVDPPVPFADADAVAAAVAALS